MGRFNGKVWESELTGKLAGIPGFSTTCKCNPICQARMMNGDLVCSACYADVTTDRYQSLEEHLEENFELLTSDLLSDRDLPRVYTRFARIESFGDVANTTQAINYLNMVKANPDTFWGIWTKNYWIWDEVFKTEEKPSNCNMVLSSEKFNEITDKDFWWVDKVFTVYTADFIAEHNIEINCGSRDCVGCHTCYCKNDIKHISEKKKAGRRIDKISKEI